MREGLSRPPRLIVCGIDFTVWSDRACAGAATLARHFGARLLLAHVGEHRRALEEVEARLQSYAREWLEGLPARTAVAVGDPAHELARLARREGADAIVIGRRHRDEPLVPVTLEAGLAETAPCPVLSLAGPDDARAVIARLERPRDADLRCTVCGRMVDGRICTDCRRRITWEAMDHKWHEELREGPGLMGLGGARALGPLTFVAPATTAAASRWDVVVLGLNQSVAAARLGARVVFGGRVGPGERGRQALRVLAAEGVDTTQVVQDPQPPTGVALMEVLAETVASASVLLTQLERPPTAIEIAARLGVRIVLDAGAPAPATDALLAAADIVRASAVEAEALSGIAVRDRTSAQRAGERLLRRGARAAVIAAPGGNMLVTPEGDRWIADFRVVPVDTTGAGAGDAFAAALAVGLAEGQPLEDTVRFAAAAAALARPGAPARPPRRAEVEALLAGRSASADQLPR
jgi:ribokinase